MVDMTIQEMWYKQRERILHDVRLMDKWVIVAPDGTVFCGDFLPELTSKAEDYERRVINKKAINAETRRYREAKARWTV